MRIDTLATCCALLIAGTSACQRNGSDFSAEPNPSAPSPEVSKTQSTKSSPPALLPGPSGCVASCIQARQMEAVAAEVIEASCKQECDKNPGAYPK
ncbi:MAG: hypothetical protein ACOC1F_00220 [Myxococcota bacterium]